MSLILDALRKADAERERGAVPGLHAQPAPLDEPAASAPSRTPPWLWAGVGLAVGLAVAVALFALSRGAAAPEPVAAAGGAPSPTPMPAGSPASVAAAPAANSPPTPQTMPPLIAEPAPWPGAEARKSGERAPDAKAPDAEGPASAPRVLTAESVPVAPEQLPENIRAQLPALTFGGSIYSSNAASRSLIVNGRLHRESEQVLPGLTLEQIKPKGAVFNFKGYRFEVVL